MGPSGDLRNGVGVGEKGADNFGGQLELSKENKFSCPLGCLGHLLIKIAESFVHMMAHSLAGSPPTSQGRLTS